MYDIGENAAALEEAESKRKAKKQERKQKRVQSIQKTGEIVRLVRAVKERKAKLAEEGKLSPQEMKFTGKMTDIAGVDGMKCTDVKKYATDKEVYEATKRNIVSARDDGYISIDDGGACTPTLRAANSSSCTRRPRISTAPMPPLAR